jgi:hypothetical protein
LFFPPLALFGAQASLHRDDDGSTVRIAPSIQSRAKQKIDAYLAGSFQTDAEAAFALA